jgi:hypothetical protein
MVVSLTHYRLMKRMIPPLPAYLFPPTGSNKVEANLDTCFRDIFLSVAPKHTRPPICIVINTGGKSINQSINHSLCVCVCVCECVCGIDYPLRGIWPATVCVSAGIECAAVWCVVGAAYILLYSIANQV